MRARTLRQQPADKIIEAERRLARRLIAHAWETQDLKFLLGGELLDFWAQVAGLNPQQITEIARKKLQPKPSEEELMDRVVEKIEAMDETPTVESETSEKEDSMQMTDEQLEKHIKDDISNIDRDVIAKNTQIARLHEQITEMNQRRETLAEDLKTVQRVNAVREHYLRKIAPSRVPDKTVDANQQAQPDPGVEPRIQKIMEILKKHPGAIGTRLIHETLGLNCSKDVIYQTLLVMEKRGLVSRVTQPGVHAVEWESATAGQTVS